MIDMLFDRITNILLQLQADITISLLFLMAFEREYLLT